MSLTQKMGPEQRGEALGAGIGAHDATQGRPARMPRWLTTFDAKLDPAVHIVCPDGLWRFTVQQGEDPSAQVGLAGSLGGAGDSNDCCSRSVPGQELGRAEGGREGKDPGNQSLSSGSRCHQQAV